MNLARCARRAMRALRAAWPCGFDIIYLRKHVLRMHVESIVHFGGGFRAERWILTGLPVDR